MADEIVGNATLLQDQLNQSSEQLTSTNLTVDMIESLIQNTSTSLDDSEAFLEDSRDTISSSRSTLFELGRRIRGLELQVEQNEVDLEMARNLTDVAARIANQTELVGVVITVQLQL